MSEESALDTQPPQKPLGRIEEHWIDNRFGPLTPRNVPTVVPKGCPSHSSGRATCSLFTPRIHISIRGFFVFQNRAVTDHCLEKQKSPANSRSSLSPGGASIPLGKRPIKHLEFFEIFDFYLPPQNLSAQIEDFLANFLDSSLDKTNTEPLDTKSHRLVTNQPRVLFIQVAHRTH